MVDGKDIIVIWCPSGINRPYDVPEYVTAKNNPQRKCYIRSGSSSIEAKGYVLDELRDMANRVPFDDRGNPEISINDISVVHVRRLGVNLLAILAEMPLSLSLNRWISLSVRKRTA